MRLFKFSSARVERQAVLLLVLAACCTTMPANAQTINNNGTGTNNGFYYSLYTSSGSATMTLGSAGNYSISWSGVGDVVGGKGFNPGSTNAIGYNVGAASGYNTISVYGWLTNPLVEYYITEFGSLYTADATRLGTVTSDGHTYTTYEHQQVNQPSIQGTQTFEQYLDAWGGAAVGQNGTVTVANHVSHWEQLGLPVGTFNYQILGTEAYNGASGYVNATVWSAGSGGGGSGGGSGGGGSGGGGSGGGSTLNTSNWYNVVNATSGLCLADVNGSTSNGTALEQYSCESNQYSWDWQFRSASTSGYYNVFNRYATALAWDDTGGSTSNGNLIQLYSGSAGNANQEWEAVSVGGGMYNFVNLKSGLCLDDPGSSTANGTQMQQYTCSSGDRNQEFSLVQVQ